MKGEVFMKNFFRSLSSGAAVVIGWLFGEWLWKEVLKEKADNLKSRLSNKGESD